MATMTYLEIVNRAITESKVSLDELTVANFANPPRTVMYKRFKDWVNVAYEELYNDHKDWFFRKERAVVTLRPRLYLGGASALLAVGDILEGRSSGTRFQIVDLVVHEEAEQNLSSEITVEVEYLDSTLATDLYAREVFDRVSPVALLDAAHLIGLGHYYFAEDIPGLEEIDPDTFVTYEIPGEDSGTKLHSVRPSSIVRPVSWPNDLAFTTFSGTTPQYISRTPYGSFALYPQPEEAIQAAFDYTRKVQLLEDALDIPEALPSEDHMYLVWKAMEEYADFDRNPDVFRRAQKHLKKYDYYLARDHLPKMTFARSRFNR